MAEVVLRAGARRAGFEAEKVTVADLEDITKKLGRVELVPLRKTVERLRRVKEGQEIELIRQAAAITDATLEAFMGQPDGRSEKMAAWEIVGLMLSRGADAAAFDPIVACGASAAEPHHEPGDQYVQPPGPLKIDMGAKYRGYCADLTRTYWLGEPDKQFRRIYTAVYQAQRKAIEEIRPGVACSYVDGLARRVIEEAGFGEAFSHGLGHGVGLEVHEAPALSKASEDVLEAGMVVTVEPGVYVPGWGGVRLEDLVVVREDGADVVSAAPKIDPADL